MENSFASVVRARDFVEKLVWSAVRDGQQCELSQCRVDTGEVIMLVLSKRESQASDITPPDATPAEVFDWITAHPLVTPEQSQQWHTSLEHDREAASLWSKQQQQAWSTSTPTS